MQEIHPVLTVPRVPELCRCPACNPLHNPGLVRRGAGHHKERQCALCKNTRLVPVIVATRYLGSMNADDAFGPYSETAEPARKHVRR